jgi:hypothetical protein
VAARAAPSAAPSCAEPWAASCGGKVKMSQYLLIEEKRGKWILGFAA